MSWSTGDAGGPPDIAEVTTRGARGLPAASVDAATHFVLTPSQTIGSPSIAPFENSAISALTAAWIAA
jgi:hypothetical protein